MQNKMIFFRFQRKIAKKWNESEKARDFPVKFTEEVESGIGLKELNGGCGNNQNLRD